MRLNLNYYSDWRSSRWSRNFEWHRWFAWYPVYFNGWIVWLETVECRLTNGGRGADYWEYRDEVV
jgi:hypothetical protein